MAYRLHDNWLIRKAIGKKIVREDLLDASGWHDWILKDLVNAETFVLTDSEGALRLGPVGEATWKEVGSENPASANCLKCHNVQEIANETSFANLVKLTAAAAKEPDRFPVEKMFLADWKKNQKPEPPKPPTPVTPRDITGPPGPKGDKGDKGDPGRDTDPSLVIKAVQDWLNAHRDELRGRDGADGKQGLDGRDGPEGKQGPAGERGQDAKLSSDLEARIKALEDRTITLELYDKDGKLIGSTAGKRILRLQAEDFKVGK